ncbi:Unknown protein sequence [Pseudomonas syringae pv. cilantro]|uniref:Uncharacterized protein n=1 Tax=Pseudomonas syringae pv. cilantro TaxID=81035 RepID=A0A0N0X7C8_PSESX|nr:Unknown protein sequence [Pseudomonas syringae pv. cilantro]
MRLDPLSILGRWHIHRSRAEYLARPGMRARTGAASQCNTAHQSQGSDLHDETPSSEKISTQ